MAVRGKPIPASDVNTIKRMAALSVRKAARLVNVSPTTVQKYRKK